MVVSFYFFLQAIWTSGDVSKAQPLFTWDNHTGVVTLTYFPAMKKFIMVVSTPTYSPYTVLQFDTYLLESDSLTGPFSYVTYMRMFGPEAYFVNFPSKFLGDIVHTAQGPAQEGVLSFSANFALKDDAVPRDSGYYWCLQPIRLILSSKFTESLQTPETWV